MEIAITEVNLRMVERERLSSVELNPSLPVQIAGLTEKIKQIQKNIDVIDKLIAEDERRLN